MAAPSVTYTFTNDTAADATEVNQNFTDIINGITDGTKDITVNLLQANGAATFNGNVTLGNATGDDITFTGRVASDIDPKTAATSTLGDATQTWQALYLDNTTTDGGAIYFDGGSTEFIKANAAGTELALGGFSALDLTGGQIVKTLSSAKSADYTVLDDDGVSSIFMTTSSTDRTVTLPTAADNTGRIITVKKVDSGSGSVTLDGESTETIDGATTKTIYAQYDSITVKCDGTAWFILDLKERPHRARYTLSSDQTLNGTSDQTIAWDTVADSVGSLLSISSGVVTVNRPCDLRVRWCLQYDISPGNTTSRLYCNRGAGDVVERVNARDTVSAGGFFQLLQEFTVFDLDDGDTVWVTQNETNASTVDVLSTGLSYMEVDLLPR